MLQDSAAARKTITMQRGGQQIPISLGRQLPLTARGPTVKAVLYHAAKMEEARVHRPGAEDSTMLMGLIGGHGYGKYRGSYLS